MDYEAMSDHDINKAVAEALDVDVDVCTVTDFIGGIDNSRELLCIKSGPWINYCNNPSDAWPIIEDNRISICFGVQTDAVSAQDGWGNNYTKIEDRTKARRACMITFLKMKEQE